MDFNKNSTAIAQVMSPSATHPGHSLPSATSMSHTHIRSLANQNVHQGSISLELQRNYLNDCVKAVPSASPLVTPEMGERLCRMASQHYMSDYNRYKRGQHPNPLLSQQLPQPNYTTPGVTSQHQQGYPRVVDRPAERLPACPPFQHHVTVPAGVSSDQTQASNQPTQPLPKTSVVHDHQFASSNPSDLVESNPEKNLKSSQMVFNPSATSTASNGYNHHPMPVDAVTNPATMESKLANPTEKRKFQDRTPSPAAEQLALDGGHTLIGVVSGDHVATKPDVVKTVHGSSVKTSQTHPMNISPVVPPELSVALADFYLTSPITNEQPLPSLPVDLYDLTGPHASRAYEEFHIHHQQRLYHFSQHHQPGLPVKDSPLGQSPPSINAVRLGNMLLSSCPGKKVRMFDTLAQRQAAGNRSPICRDLKSDLSRAQSIGVRAIICCLDDEELNYLGSPWPEYQAVASACGLAVIRIPMAEGFAPHKGVDEIDRVIQIVLENWTMKGYDVLCHCRGGVGRAGLVACCWMLKIGLINKPIHDIEHDHPRMDLANFNPATKGQTPHPVPRNSVLVQVEKVIEVIRRRRSVKAIETPQQVHFIMEYADWLDHQRK
ncbi:uncharacterized protein MELLADRAFT_79033 [Melampsora larici-populina 98AG31]|uniref:Tyrosine specific protein phosphatases domain-containing protein n=1 Tax=Melampsora larici-populina (strain 98AG31 / pathotype 3-4-7) TaxID=747676 RepID=F4S1V2_MELLP|nr:uncharacterized protein MELLADRAFT_79033 [Melampsora larici-populina 98AG31]EGG01443.1 hypothetical protein MELLADRAFT_79033 [Melampsora larici-populina 98AG31]